MQEALGTSSAAHSGFAKRPRSELPALGGDALPGELLYQFQGILR